MKRLLLLAALAVVISNGIDAAAAAELPTYESAGFPITAVQVSILGSVHVQEAPSVPALTLRGVPGSQHQIGVLTAGKRVLRREPQTRQRHAEVTR